MATLKGVQRAKRGPSYSGKYMIDTVRGVLRVRKWPRKRGTPKSALQLWWIDWFRQANYLAKYVDAASARRAIEITANSGMYPRDVLLAAMRGRLYIWQDKAGKVWHPMAAVQDISDSLDVLAQNVGNVLVRAVDRWRAAEPAAPALGQVLTSQGPGLPPKWSTPGAGVTQIVVPGTPIVPAGSVSFYDLDISTFAIVDVVIADVGFAATDRPTMRFSTDGGATFKSAGTDYPLMNLTDASSGFSNQNRIFSASDNGTSGHHAVVRLSGLRAGRASATVMAARSGSTAYSRAHYANFSGPITDLRILSLSGNNFNAGTIYATGIAAA